jgi:predicted esterase
VDYLDDVVDAMRPAGARLVVLGFSQGVTTMARWLGRGRTRAAQVVCWAGEWPKDVDAGAHRERWPAGGIDLVCGRDDAYLEWIGVERQAQRFAAAGVPTRVTWFDGGHRLDRATLLGLTESR